jgi:fibronectin-binding autotransporter adhesin
MFTAFNNTSVDAISGVFGNLADGGFFNAGANVFQASYSGGDGNDLTLVAVPEPSAGVILLGGIAMMLGVRRRRRE